MTLQEAIALIPGQVAAGVAYLETERNRPDWARELKESLETASPRTGLRMSDCCLCVCGRLFRDWYAVEGALERVGRKSKDLGFGPAYPQVNDPDDIDAYYAALAAEWLRVMNAKLQEYDQ